MILRNGDVEVEWNRGDPRPAEVMSVAKTIVAAGVGVCLGDPADAYLETPLTRWIPEWEDTPKATITLRHVMMHISGLSTLNPRDIYGLSDVESSAIVADLVDPPGKRWVYNNLAFHLLGVIVRRSAGTTIKELLSRDLFSPMGIEIGYWSEDAGGHPYCMSNVSMRAIDLARIGRLFLNGGRHDGRQVLPPTWVAALPPRPGHEVGCGTFAQYDRGPGEAVKRSIIGFGHDGWLGQWLSVQPATGRVAVRLRAEGEIGDDWASFPGDVSRLRP